MSTLRKLIFAGINFHKFGEFLTISRKLVPAKIIGDCATREIPGKWGLFARENNNFVKYFLIETLRLDNTLTWPYIQSNCLFLVEKKLRLASNLKIESYLVNISVDSIKQDF